MTGTAAPVGSPAPSLTTTVTGSPVGSYGVSVMTAPTSASAGGVPKASEHAPVTEVARSPIAVTLLPGGPLKLLDCLALIVHAPVPAYEQGT